VGALFYSAAPIPSHLVAAMLAVLIGAGQLLSEKGTPRHRILGRVWVGLMVYVAGSSFFISELKMWGALNPIYLLSAWTLILLVIAVYDGKWSNARQHRLWMLSLYAFSPMVTGVFTLWPGRLLHQIILPRSSTLGLLVSANSSAV